MLGTSTIDGGVLRFKSSPDYENPTADGGDNEYHVTVRSTDVRPDGAKGGGTNEHAGGDRER